MMYSVISLSLSANVAFASIPGWDSYKLKDFCNGSCPSTPDSSGLPHYGQNLFPAMTFDSDGNIYLVTATFGGAYLDDAQLTSLSPAGKPRWSLNQSLASGPQSAYWMQIFDDALYVQSSSCCTPDGATKGHMVKVALNGTALWSRDVVGSPSLGYDGIIYTLATPDTGKGSIVSAMSRESGKHLWSYNDGVSRFSYLEIGGAQADYGYLCMPAQAGQNKSVVCLDSSGGLTHTKQVTDSSLVRYDLIANKDHYYVRVFRDNSYYHKGTNEMFELGSEPWTQDFPDDLAFVGVISRTSADAFVVLTRPDCANIPSGLGCRPDSLIAIDPTKGIRWNVTLPGAGDATVNPAFPPQFGPYGASNGMVFASSVQRLHSDNKTYDMWYSAVDAEGALVWKLSIDNIQDLTRVLYAANAAGDFHVVFDGVLYKVPANKSTGKITYV